MSIAKRIISCMLLMCVMFTAAPFDGTYARAEEESFSFTIPVAYDTYIRKGYGNDYSGDTTMIVDGRASSERVGVMRFRYGSGASDSVEAVRDTSNLIVLRIRVNQNLGVPSLAIYGVNDEVMKSEWDDGSMNYNLATGLGMLAARGSEKVPLLAVQDMESVSAADYLEFDVTDYVKQQMNRVNDKGDGECVFLICAMNSYSPNDYFRIYQDNGKDTMSADNVPKLIVSGGREGYLKRDTMSLDIEKKHQVTENFVLPAVLGADRDTDSASEVEWRSDTEGVIALERNGDTYTAIVNRPDSSKHGDAVVTLSAEIKNGDLSGFKSFKLYVPPKGVYNPILTNYIRSNSAEESNPDSVIYSYVKSKTKYVGFVKFPYVPEAFGYTPKAVLRLKPYFMQGAFTLTITAVSGGNAEKCSETMTWSGSQDLIDDKGVYSEVINQNPSDMDWIEWDITDYINSIGGDAVFKLEIASSGTSYCMFYGNREKYMPQLKLYNYELITDAEKSIQAVAEKVRSDLGMMSGELSAVTGDIELPNPGLYGVTVDWSAFDENGGQSEYISSGGRLIKQPEDADKKVKLRAVISRGDCAETVTIETDATVLKKATDEEAVKFNEEKLALSSGVLTSGGKLPQGFYGVSVEWSAEPADCIKIDGANYTVIKRDTDTPVTLTAKLQKGDVNAEKSFNAEILRDSKQNLIYGLQIVGGDTDMEKTNDDNMLTYYSQNGDFNIDYKLLNEKSAGSVVIVPYKSGNIKNIGIYISGDGVQWKKLDETAVHEGINNISFPAENAAYLRLSVMTSGEAGIREAGIYAADDNETVVTASDIINSAEFIKLSGLPSGLVKNDFKLKKTVKDADIKWYSDNNAVISLTEAADTYNASVKRADKTKGVKLKAVVSINGTTAEKEFSVSVSGTEQSLSSGGGGGGGASKPKTTAKPQETDAPKPTDAPSETDAPKPSDKPENTADFKDLDQAAWAKEYIAALCQKGIISGRTKTEFAPMENITREEFVKLIAIALELEEGGGCDFSDVAKTAWYYPYICSAVKAGAVSGTGGGKFGTGNKITRQDMAVIISRMLNNADYAENGAAFNDSGKIADYAVDAVAKLNALGIMSGDEQGNVNPLSFATRAEAAKMIYMMLEVSERN